MGKLIYFITALIFIDLLFITTGQLCATGTCSLSSIIFNALLNLSNFDATTFFSELIGDASALIGSGTGIAALIATGGVIIGAFFATREITILFIPITLTFALLAGDLILIFSYLASFNFVLATFIVGPLVLVYILTVVEWLRGKD
jgi:hypothetical protein